MIRVAEETTAIQSKSNHYNAGTWDIYWLGLTIVIGGQLIYWNEGLNEGFWPYFLTVFFVGTGYLCLTLCIAEMTSFLPFAGGSYGYCRCALGPIPGFLVGVCETIEYVLYVTSAVVELGSLLSFVLDLDTAYEPLYWLLFFIISLFIQVYSQRIFWYFNAVIAAITLALILTYFFGSIPAFDFRTNLGSTDFHIFGGMNNFMYFFPLASWFYVGVEVMTLSCSEVKDAGKAVPRAMVACMITLFITSFLILFASSLQSPGPNSLPTEFLPLNPGYQTALKLSSQLATLLAIPGTFATAFGFMFAYGRQIYSMSTSGLFPHFLSMTYGEHKAPITALFLGSTLSYGTLIFLWYVYPNFSRQLFNLCMLGSCSVYVALFRSYIVCKKRYSNLPRQFNNYLGTFSAFYGMAVFSFMIIALAFFQRDNYITLAIFISFIILFLLYYFLVVQKREFFSDEEQAKFMKAHILNASEKRRQMKNNKFNKVVSFLTGFTSSKQSTKSSKNNKNNNNNHNKILQGSFSASEKGNQHDNSRKGKNEKQTPATLAPARKNFSSTISHTLSTIESALSSYQGSNKIIPFNAVLPSKVIPGDSNQINNTTIIITPSEPPVDTVNEKSLFFNVNGRLIQLNETSTTIIQC